MDTTSKYLNNTDNFDIHSENEIRNLDKVEAENFKKTAVDYINEQMSDEPGTLTWICYFLIIICIWLFVFVPLLLIIFTMFTELLNQLLSIISLAFIFARTLQIWFTVGFDTNTPDYVPLQFLSQLCWIIYSMPVVTFFVTMARDLTSFCFNIIKEQITDFDYHKQYLNKIKRWLFFKVQQEREVEEALLTETRPQTLKIYETFYYILAVDNKEKKTQAIALSIFVCITFAYVICFILSLFNVTDMSTVLYVYTALYLVVPCIGILDCILRSWRNLTAICRFKVVNKKKLDEINNIEIRMKKQREQFEIDEKLYKLGIGSNPDTFQYHQQQRYFEESIQEKKNELKEVRWFDPCYFTTNIIKWLYNFHIFEMVYPPKMVGQDKYAEAIQKQTLFIEEFPTVTFGALIIGVIGKIYLFIQDWGINNANSYYPNSIYVTALYLFAAPYILIMSHITGTYAFRQRTDRAKEKQEKMVKNYQFYFEGEKIVFFPQKREEIICDCCSQKIEKLGELIRKNFALRCRCECCCECCRCKEKRIARLIEWGNHANKVEYKPLQSAWAQKAEENKQISNEIGYSLASAINTDQADDDNGDDPESPEEKKADDKNGKNISENGQNGMGNDKDNDNAGEQETPNPNIPEEDEFGNTPETTQEPHQLFSFDAILNTNSINFDGMVVQGIYVALMIIVILAGIALSFWQAPIEQICHEKIYLPSLIQQGYFDPPPVNNTICSTTINGLTITELAALPIIAYFSNGEIEYETRKHNIEVIIDLAFGRTRTRSMTFDMKELNCIDYNDCIEHNVSDIATVLEVYNNGILDYNILIPFGLRDKGDWIPVLEMYLQQFPGQLLGEIVPLYDFFMNIIGDTAFQLTSALQKVCGVRSVTTKHALRILDLASQLKGDHNIAVGQTIGGYFAKYIGYMLRQNFSSIGFDSLSFQENALVTDYSGDDDIPISMINIYADGGLLESAEEIPFNYRHAAFDFGWQTFFRPPNATDAFCHAVAECSTDQMHIDFCDRMLGHERFMSTMVDIFHRQWHPINDEDEENQ